MNRYQVLGISDDKDFCQCCGKTGLKRVVFIEDTETGEVQHFGTTCATAPSKGFNVDKEVKQAIADAKQRAEVLARLAYAAYKKAGGQYVPSGPYSWTPADPVMYANIKASLTV